MSKESTTTLSWIKDYWFLIVFLGGMLITWGVITQKINIIETRQDILDAKVEENNTTLSELRGGIIRIETTLDFIKQTLE